MLIPFEKITRGALAPLGFVREEICVSGAFFWEKSVVSQKRIVVKMEGSMKNGQLKAFINFGIQDDNLVRAVESIMGKLAESSTKPLLAAFIGEMFPDQFALARSEAPVAEKLALAAKNIGRPASERRFFVGVPVGMYFGPSRKEAVSRWTEMLGVLMEELQALDGLLQSGSYISFFDETRFPLGYKNVFCEALVAAVFSGVDGLNVVIESAIGRIARDKQGPEDLRRQSIMYVKNVHEMFLVNADAIRDRYEQVA